MPALAFPYNPKRLLMLGTGLLPSIILKRIQLVLVHQIPLPRRQFPDFLAGKRVGSGLRIRINQARAIEL